MVAKVSEVWLAVMIVGSGAIMMKAAGPVAVGGRELPERAMLLVSALAPALLAAFVVTNTFGQGRSLVVDACAPGLLAASVCIALRAPLLVSIVTAGAVTAIARAV